MAFVEGMVADVIEQLMSSLLGLALKMLSIHGSLMSSRLSAARMTGR